MHAALGPNVTCKTTLLLLLLLQVLTFVSSLFGDLIESIMKRDAGIKVGRLLRPQRSLCWLVQL